VSELRARGTRLGFFVGCNWKAKMVWKPCVNGRDMASFHYMNDQTLQMTFGRIRRHTAAGEELQRRLLAYLKDKYKEDIETPKDIAPRFSINVAGVEIVIRTELEITVASGQQHPAKVTSKIASYVIDKQDGNGTETLLGEPMEFVFAGTASHQVVVAGGDEEIMFDENFTRAMLLALFAKPGLKFKPLARPLDKAT
jgi:hypothetical protein